MSRNDDEEDAWLQQLRDALAETSGQDAPPARRDVAEAEPERSTPDAELPSSDPAPDDAGAIAAVPASPSAGHHLADPIIERALWSLGERMGTLESLVTDLFTALKDRPEPAGPPAPVPVDIDIDSIADQVAEQVAESVAVRVSAAAAAAAGPTSADRAASEDFDERMDAFGLRFDDLATRIGELGARISDGFTEAADAQRNLGDDVDLLARRVHEMAELPPAPESGGVPADLALRLGELEVQQAKLVESTERDRRLLVEQAVEEVRKLLFGAK